MHEGMNTSICLVRLLKFLENEDVRYASQTTRCSKFRISTGTVRTGIPAKKIRLHSIPLIKQFSEITILTFINWFYLHKRYKNFVGNFVKQLSRKIVVSVFFGSIASGNPLFKAL